MYCSNCGAEIPDGSAFCTSCGEKLSGASPVPQPAQGQPVYDQSAYSQQPYGQPPYGSSYDTYGQPPHGQPPKKGKPKTWLLIAGGAVLLLAIAAVLVFVVFGGGAGWPLSGSTMQTKFVNDSFQVFGGAFSDLGNADMAKLLNEPFDAEMDVSVNTGMVPMDITLSAVYDKEQLGLLAEAMGQPVIVLLEGDTAYASVPGSVSGIRFDTDADLSKPMTLRERIEALTENLAENSDVDYMLVMEAMVNSINPECFKKAGNETTLTLTRDDAIEMLQTLQEKAEKDKALSDALDEMDADLEEAIDSLEASDADYELIWTVTYDGGAPVSLEIDYDDGTDYGTFNLQFGYEKTGDGKDLSLNMTGGGSELDASMSITRNGKDVEYDGEMEVSYGGISSETYTIEGSESWDGDEVKGSVAVTDNYGTAYGLEYDGTITFGMPEEKVEDDSRFDVDTSNANVQDIEDLFSLNSYISPVSAIPDYDDWATAAPVESDWTMPSEAPAAAAGVIGVVLPTVNTTYYTTLVTDMSSEASYYGWTVSVYTTDYTGSEEGALMALMAEGVDAVIIDPNGLTASAIQTLESDCLAAGLPCVMLLDEGETPDGSVSAVSFDLVGAGADMAFKCALGNVYVVGGDSYSSETSGIEQGLFYDSSFGISGYSGIEVAGTAYASGQSVETLVENALLTNPDINTFICTDPDLADDVLAVLESASYSGNLLCYTYETTKDEMGSGSFSVYVTCEYFEMTDIASNAMTAVADQLEYGRGPQVYTIYSTNF